MNASIVIVQCAAITVGIIAASLALLGRRRPELAQKMGSAVLCRRNGSCDTLFAGPAAALLGLPNALFGLVFYVALGIGLMAGVEARYLFIAACFALSMSIYLAGYLLRNRLSCRICWIGHASNLVLWLTLLSQTFFTRR